MKPPTLPMQEEETFLSKMDLITGFDPFGLLRIQEIIEEAARTDGYSKFVDKVNSHFGEVVLGRNDLLRLRAIASGEHSPKLLRKLVFIAPFTKNPSTGEPYLAGELKAIAKGEKKGVNPEEGSGFLDQALEYAGQEKAEAALVLIDGMQRDEFTKVLGFVNSRAIRELRGDSMALDKEDNLIDLIKDAVAQHGLKGFEQLTGMPSGVIQSIMAGEAPTETEYAYLGRGLKMHPDKVRAIAERTIFNNAAIQINHDDSVDHKHENGCNGATNGASKH